jgi:hypothetical protein
VELGPNDERFRSPETHFEWGDIQIQTSTAKLSISTSRSPSASQLPGSLNPPSFDSTYPKGACCRQHPLGMGDPNRHLNTPLFIKTREYTLKTHVFS